VADPPARALPNWKEIHQELRRKSVTLQLLWNESMAAKVRWIAGLGGFLK
jgi:transposase